MSLDIAIFIGKGKWCDILSLSLPHLTEKYFKTCSGNTAIFGDSTRKNRCPFNSFIAKFNDKIFYDI
jgi:hypothetical protein